MKSVFIGNKSRFTNKLVIPNVFSMQQNFIFKISYIDFIEYAYRLLLNRGRIELLKFSVILYLIVKPQSKSVAQSFCTQNNRSCKNMPTTAPVKVANVQLLLVKTPLICSIIILRKQDSDKQGSDEISDAPFTLIGAIS